MGANEGKCHLRECGFLMLLASGSRASVPRTQNLRQSKSPDNPKVLTPSSFFSAHSFPQYKRKEQKVAKAGRAGGGHLLSALKLFGTGVEEFASWSHGIATVTPFVEVLRSCQVPKAGLQRPQLIGERETLMCAIITEHRLLEDREQVHFAHFMVPALGLDHSTLSINISFSSFLPTQKLTLSMNGFSQRIRYALGNNIPKFSPSRIFPRITVGQGFPPDPQQ